MSNEQQQHVSVSDPRAISRDVFSATLGSVCCCYTGQPLDTIKVRMQTNPERFSGVVSTTTSIFKNEVGPTGISDERHAESEKTSASHKLYFILLRLGIGCCRILERGCTYCLWNGCRKCHGLWCQ